MTFSFAEIIEEFVLSSQLALSNGFDLDSIEQMGLGKADTKGKFYDPHMEADQWVAMQGDQDALGRLRETAEARHRLIIKELSKVILSQEQKRAINAAGTARWLNHHRTEHSAACKSWYRKNLQRRKEYMRQYRADVRANPELLEALRASEKIRKAKYRAQFAKPRVKVPVDERKARKRAYDRTYQRKHPRVYTETQMEARRVAARILYQKRNAK